MSAPAVAAAPQTNGVPPSSQSAPSTQQQATQSTQTAAGGSQSQSQSQPPASQPSQQQQQQQQQQQPQQSQPTNSSSNNQTTSAPRPRDARTLELLLTAQGVTSFEQRVPLLLLDFAYRHTASVLSDALHLAADPYVSHAGARPSAASGAAPVNAGDAAITASAVQLAIASRLGYQFRGGGSGGGVAGIGGGGGGGGASKEWLMELARERNKIALPRVQPSEWGVRLPGERFVLSGVSWGLRDVWAGQEDGSDESSEEEDGDKMAVDGPGGAGEAMETEDVGGDGVEGGTMDDVFGDDLEDEEMAEA
ncbi:hypothetical protein VTJ04DRAFT_3273 [Mycothermus thermophilus]|uniref:uncharacterized protein n=1 Tax=Humicola insolens TaxID=85995 RepID=UPI003741F0B1